MNVLQFLLQLRYDHRRSSITHVTTNMKLEDVKAIAEGRVWTGEQALKRGLVDKLGNLDDAIAEAAQLAELEEYSVDTYPAPANFFEQMVAVEMDINVLDWTEVTINNINTGFTDETQSEIYE